MKKYHLKEADPGLTYAPDLVEVEKIFGRNHSVILVVDPVEQGIVYANNSASEFYGYTRKELMQMRVYDINILPKEETRHYVESINKNKIGQAFFTHRLKNGAIKFVNALVSPLNIDGRALNLAIIQDITAQKEAEERIKQSEERFRNLVSEMNIGVVLHGPDLEILLVNPKAMEMLGFNEEQLLGKKTIYAEENVIHEDGSVFPINDRPVYEAFRTKKTVKNKIMGVYHPLIKEHVWLLATSQPVLNKEGNIQQVITTFTNITENIVLQKKILALNTELRGLSKYLQQVRIEEKNTFAIEVHDKLGQGLTALKYEIDWLKKHLNEDKPVIEERVTTLLSEIDTMVRDFKKIYGEINPTLLEHLGLFDAVNLLVSSIRKKSGLKIMFTSNTENREFSQAIKLTFYKTATECLNNIIAHANATDVSVSLMKHDNTLNLYIRDNGSGFDLSKVNTKEHYGILEIREMVYAIGGKLNISSAVGEGTSIELSIDIVS